MLWDLKASCGKGNKSNFVWDGGSEGVEDTKKTYCLGKAVQESENNTITKHNTENLASSASTQVFIPELD